MSLAGFNCVGSFLLTILRCMVYALLMLCFDLLFCEFVAGVGLLVLCFVICFSLRFACVGCWVVCSACLDLLLGIVYVFSLTLGDFINYLVGCLLGFVSLRYLF